jgi:DNA-binding PadR family transcriptional regulator
VRIKNAIDNGIIAEIGTMHSGKGRPKKIYTTTPVSKDVLEQASAAGVQLYNQYNTVTVVNVDTASNATNTETETENETVDVSDKVNA